jgi:serralysin
VNIEGAGRIESMTLNRGVNSVTTADRYVHLIDSWMGENTIKIGDGGVGSIQLYGDGTMAQKITASGHVNNLQVHDDLKATVKLGDGGAKSIQLHSANDTVITGKGWVELISTHGGNDKITVGAGGAGFVRAGDGNDVIKVSEMDGTFGLSVNAGSGTDTLDFSKFGTSVTFSLAEVGQFQNVGRPDDLTASSVGYFAEHSVENITGGRKNDTLSGDFASNVLKGGRGNDTLAGREGDDVLFGNGGRDTFVFGADGGTDTVKGYAGVDTLQIEDHTGGFAALNISNASGNRVIEYDGGTIILQGKAGISLDASDFDFV